MKNLLTLALLLGVTTSVFAQSKAEKEKRKAIGTEVVVTYQEDELYFEDDNSDDAYLISAESDPDGVCIHFEDGDSTAVLNSVEAVSFANYNLNKVLGEVDSLSFSKTVVINKIGKIQELKSTDRKVIGLKVGKIKVIKKISCTAEKSG